MTPENVLVTTSIPYVNGAPHVGFAWELVLADALARYHRCRGRRVRFLTGTDDNSLKNVQAAAAQGADTASFVRRQGDRFEALARALQLSNDDFIRTGFDARHAPAVAEIWRRCAERGDVYARSYEGWYCTGCEQFYAPSEVEGGRCPDHETLLERVSEHNHFFRLSRHQPHLEAARSARVPGVYPESYQAELEPLLASGLTDFSISRPRERARGWGIPVPGDSSQTVYVWFDALVNYLSGLDFAGGGELFEQFWRQSTRRIHVIGKNVTRFHCVYWPAILESAGLGPPSDVIVHGFLTVNGRKIGKSLGNGVDPFELVERFGSDRLRYYLLRHFPLGRDGDFSSAALILGCNAQLADQLGNLLNRVAVLIEKHAAGRVPEAFAADAELLAAASSAAEGAVRELERGAPDQALVYVDRFVESANLHVSRREPWKLASAAATAEGPERQWLEHELASVLGDGARALLWAGALLEPFLPEAARRIGETLGSPLPRAYLEQASALWPGLAAGAVVSRTGVLFARLEREASPPSAGGAAASAS